MIKKTKNRSLQRNSWVTPWVTPFCSTLFLLRYFWKPILLGTWMMNSYSWTRRLFMQIVFHEVTVRIYYKLSSCEAIHCYYLNHPFSLSFFSKYVFMIARSYAEVAGATSQPDCSPTQRLPSEDEEDEEEEPPKPEVRENGPSWRVSVGSLLWFLSHAILVEINLDLVFPLSKINYWIQCFSLIRLKKSKTDTKVHNLDSCFVRWIHGKWSKTFFLPALLLQLRKSFCDFMSD